MRDHSTGANYTLSRTERLIGWLLPLLLAVASILGAFFVKGDFGTMLRQFFLLQT